MEEEVEGLYPVCYFENVTEYHYENMLEVGKSIYWKRTGILVVIYAALFCLVILPMAFTDLSSFYFVAAVYVIAILAMLFYYLVFIPKLWAKRLVKQSVFMNGKPVVSRVRFYQSSMEVLNESNGAHTVYQMGNVLKIVETKNCCILRLSGNLMIILRTDGFCYGDPAQFRQYLATVCPNAKWR